MKGKVFDLILKKYCTVYVLMLLVLYIIFHDSVISCTPDGWMYGWIDNLGFYVLFNSIKCIPERWTRDNERLCAVELR